MLRRSKQAANVAIPAIASPPVLSPEIKKAARVEAELADTRRDHAAAQADVDAARTDYEVAADVGHLSKAVAAKAALAEAETRADIAGRRVARLDAELQVLLDGAADAAAGDEREQLRETAREALAEYRREFQVRMPAITSQLRGLIRLQAQAEMAREAASAAGVHDPVPMRPGTSPVRPAWRSAGRCTTCGSTPTAACRTVTRIRSRSAPTTTAPVPSRATTTCTGRSGSAGLPTSHIGRPCRAS